MQRKIEIFIIYLTGLMQGLVLISLPAASAVFTDGHGFAFSSVQYSQLFIPQVLMTILAAFFAPRFSLMTGSKRMYQAGLAFNLSAMVLMATCQLFVHKPAIAYLFLMLSSSAVGAAFGTTLPMINAYAQRFFPANPAGALTGLHTLLGTGTAIAPMIIVVLIHGFGWWLMPVGSFLILAMILGVSFFIPLGSEKRVEVKQNFLVMNKELWLFMLIVFLYGFCETLFSNWSIIYLNKEKSLSIQEASYALAIFWAMVTVGRLITAVLTVWIKPAWIYRLLPLLIAISLGLITKIANPMMGIFIFGLAGLACSAFFPLTFSFAQGYQPASAEMIAGFLMAFYMAGYGLASFGIGFLMKSQGSSLQVFYQASVLIAFIVLVLSFFLTRLSVKAAL